MTTFYAIRIWYLTYFYGVTVAGLEGKKQLPALRTRKGDGFDGHGGAL